MGMILTPVLAHTTHFAQYMAISQSQSHTFWEIFSERYKAIDTAGIAGVISVFGWWAILGILILYFIRVALSVFLYIETVAELMQFKRTNKKAYLGYLLGKLVISILGIIGIAVYSSIFFKVILASLTGFVSTLYLYQTWVGIGGVLLSILMLMGAFHVFVILIRLTFLRIRLFSWVTPT